MYVYEIAEELKIKTPIVSKVLKHLKLIELVGFEQHLSARHYFLKRSDLVDLVLKFKQAIIRE